MKGAKEISGKKWEKVWLVEHGPHIQQPLAQFKPVGDFVPMLGSLLHLYRQIHSHHQSFCGNIVWRKMGLHPSSEGPHTWGVKVKWALKLFWQHMVVHHFTNTLHVGFGFNLSHVGIHMISSVIPGSLILFMFHPVLPSTGVMLNTKMERGKKEAKFMITWKNMCENRKLKQAK